MEFIPTVLPEVVLIKPDIFADDRGYFFESYHAEKFAKNGIKTQFVQDNESKSQKGVLRGLHFQLGDYAQGKLIRVIQGAVLDVVVDIRKSSPNFGKWVSSELNAENKWLLWIPPGFAHGFITLQDSTVFAYKCTQVYHKVSEGSIRWNDPDLNIDWGTTQPILSEKDSKAPLLKDAKLFE